MYLIWVFIIILKLVWGGLNDRISSKPCSSNIKKKKTVTADIKFIKNKSKFPFGEISYEYLHYFRYLALSLRFLNLFTYRKFIFTCSSHKRTEIDYISCTHRFFSNNHVCQEIVPVLGNNVIKPLLRRDWWEFVRCSLPTRDALMRFK